MNQLNQLRILRAHYLNIVFKSNNRLLADCKAMQAIIKLRKAASYVSK